MSNEIASTGSSILVRGEDVGVIVGRFQTPYLHEGHKDFINKVAAKHKTVLVFLGVSPNKRSRKDPLDFEARRIMFSQQYPGVVIQPLSDMQSDGVWSAQLDRKICELFPFASIRLYGGRDSFLAHYRGSFSTSEIAPVIYTSATSLRDETGHDVKESSDWRAGVIYGAYNQYPKTWQTVDIAPLRTNEEGDIEILMAKKPNEREWRFIGGFVDPSDLTLEIAARREVSEEAHIEVGGFRYISSRKIDDWRYRNDVDKVMTTFFAADYIYGAPRPDDDIEALGWFVAKRKSPRSVHHIDIVPAHCEIFADLLEYLEKNYATGTKDKSVTKVGQLQGQS